MTPNNTGQLPNRSSSYFFSLIHTALGIGVPVLIVLLVSCLEATEDPIDFGPINTASSVANALNQPFDSISPDSILLGEFVHIETSQAINGGSKFVTTDTGITIINRQENTNDIDLTLAIEEITYDTDGESEQAIFENNVTVPKTTTLSIANTKITMMPTFGLNKTVQTQETISACEPTNNSAVSFHNLEVINETSNVPTAVDGSAFCQGKSPCLIPKTLINFDQVITSADGSTEKVRCEFTYSTEVPYLAAQLKKCITLVVPIEGRSILLTECSEIKNFQFGQQ